MKFSRQQRITGVAWLTALTTACGGTPAETSAEPAPGIVSAFAEEIPPGAPTAIVFNVDKPSIVQFDATGDKVVFQPASTKPLQFESWTELAEFAHKTLNAQVHKNPETGAMEGVSGDYVLAGAPALVDGETKEIHDVINPVGAFLGGLQGYIYVGKEPICVRPEICGDLQIPPIERAEGKKQSADDGPTDGDVRAAGFGTGTFCNSSGFCIRGYSITLHTVFHMTSSVTERVSGGTRTERFFCWRGIIPWVCSRQVGEPHTMRVAVTHRDLFGGSFSGGTSAANNTEKVERGSFWIGPFNPFNPPTAIRAWSTCGTHSGNTGSGSTGSRKSEAGIWSCP